MPAFFLALIEKASGNCYLTGQAISRRWDQPANGGGNYYAFQLAPQKAYSWWTPIDDLSP